VERKMRLKHVGGFSEEALCQHKIVYLGLRYGTSHEMMDTDNNSQDEYHSAKQAEMDGDE
jgi:hypothetical protein